MKKGPFMIKKPPRKKNGSVLESADIQTAALWNHCDRKTQREAKLFFRMPRMIRIER